MITHMKWTEDTGPRTRPPWRSYDLLISHRDLKCSYLFKPLMQRRRLAAAAVGCEGPFDILAAPCVHGGSCVLFEMSRHQEDKRRLSPHL